MSPYEMDLQTTRRAHVRRRRTYNQARRTYGRSWCKIRRWTWQWDGVMRCAVREVRGWNQLTHRVELP